METTNYNRGNKSLKIILAFIVLLFVFMWLKGCFNHKETIEVTIPKMEGKTNVLKPKNEPLEDNNTHGPNISKKAIKNGNKANKYGVLIHGSKYQKIIDSLSEENENLKKAFASETDKSKLDSLYQKAIQLNKFSHTWDNDTIKLDVFGISRGTVESIQAKWQVKERKQQIKVPKNVFTLLGGAEVGMTKELSKINIKANMGFQNKRGDIISASVDSEQRIYVGYAFKIFSIKK